MNTQEHRRCSRSIQTQRRGIVVRRRTWTYQVDRIPGAAIGRDIHRQLCGAEGAGPDRGDLPLAEVAAPLLKQQHPHPEPIAIDPEVRPGRGVSVTGTSVPGAASAASNAGRAWRSTRSTRRTAASASKLATSAAVGRWPPVRASASTRPYTVWSPAASNQHTSRPRSYQVTARMLRPPDRSACSLRKGPPTPCIVSPLSGSARRRATKTARICSATSTGSAARSSQQRAVMARSLNAAIGAGPGGGPGPR